MFSILLPYNIYFYSNGGDSDLQGFGCPDYKCSFTYNKSAIDYADLVLFSTW